MEKVLLNSKQLVDYRNKSGFTQANMADKLNITTRTYQKLEDEKNPIEITFKETDKLSQILGIYPYILWKKIPFRQEVFRKIISSESAFSKMYDLCKKSDGILIANYIPNDPDIEKSLVELTRIFHDEKFPTKHFHNAEYVKFTKNIRDLYREVTHPNKIDKCIASCFYYTVFRYYNPEQYGWYHRYTIYLDKYDSNISDSIIVDTCDSYSQMPEDVAEYDFYYDQPVDSLPIKEEKYLELALNKIPTATMMEIENSDNFFEHLQEKEDKKN